MAEKLCDDKIKDQEIRSIMEQTVRNFQGRVSKLPQPASSFCLSLLPLTLTLYAFEDRYTNPQLVHPVYSIRPVGSISGLFHQTFSVINDGLGLDRFFLFFFFCTIEPMASAAHGLSPFESKCISSAQLTHHQRNSVK